MARRHRSSAEDRPFRRTLPHFLWTDSTRAARGTIERLRVRGRYVWPEMSAQPRGANACPGPAEIDARCVADSGTRGWTPEQAAAHASGSRTRRRGRQPSGAPREHRSHTVTTTGPGGSAGARHPGIYTAKEPVGAPIFYRDVPLDLFRHGSGRGVIASAELSRAPLPLVGLAAAQRCRRAPAGWLIARARPLLRQPPLFSKDGKTVAMDVDGPERQARIRTPSRRWRSRGCRFAAKMSSPGTTS